MPLINWLIGQLSEDNKGHVSKAISFCHTTNSRPIWAKDRNHSLEDADQCTSSTSSIMPRFAKKVSSARLLATNSPPASLHSEKHDHVSETFNLLLFFFVNTQLDWHVIIGLNGIMHRMIRDVIELYVCIEPGVGCYVLSCCSNEIGIFILYTNNLEYGNWSLNDGEFAQFSIQYDNWFGLERWTSEMST